MQPTGAERTVRLNPIPQDPFNHGFQRGVQWRKTIPQQQAQVDALRAIVKLAFVNGQTRGFGKRLRKPVVGKEILEIVTDAFGKRSSTRFMSSESVDFGQSLHDKTSVEVINKVTHTIDGVRPGTVRILILE